MNTEYFKDISANAEALKPAGGATSGDMEKERGPAGCLPGRTESKPEEMTAQADPTHSGWRFLPPFVAEPSLMSLPGFKLTKPLLSFEIKFLGHQQRWPVAKPWILSLIIGRSITFLQKLS